MSSAQVLRAWWFQLALVAIAAVLVYSNTLDVPFYLDDHSSITENAAVQDLGDMSALWRYARVRTVGYLTLALNYHWHGTSVTGYHIVNLLIHIAAGLAVFGFVRSILKTPMFADDPDSVILNWLPLVVALLFIVHPLQTQAVTYIVQRLASLAALFYVAAMACYVQARLGSAGARTWIWGALTVVFAVLGMLTKQNTITLPVALLLIEWVFFRPDVKRLGILIGGGIAAVGVIWLTYALVSNLNPFAIADLLRATRETTDTPRLSYFSTQLVVMWEYIRLFFWPVGLHLDHDVALIDSPADPRALVALGGHLLVLALGIGLRTRLPLVAFGILFYYVAHAVESSVIPIRHLVFEHRTYLPNLGLCIVVGTLALGARRWLPARALAGTLAVVLLVLAVLAFQRNQHWRDPILFWERNAELTPYSPRPLEELAKLKLQEGQTEEGLRLLEQSLKMGCVDGGCKDVMRPSAAINYAVVLQQVQRYADALAVLEQLSAEPLKRRHYVVVMQMKGDILLMQRRPAEAAAAYRQVLKLSPDDLQVLANLAKAMAAQGDIAAFERIYAQIRSEHPDAREVIAHLDRVRAVLQTQ